MCLSRGSQGRGEARALLLTRLTRDLHIAVTRAGDALIQHSRLMRQMRHRTLSN
jgi:hypothetical protein